LHDLNKYCFAAQPIQQSESNENNDKQQRNVHPLVVLLNETIISSSIMMKNVDLLTEVERLCLLLGGCRITFCKSGKDRTGMAVTLEQSRQLGERFYCGNTQSRILRDANLMRIHGTRLLVAEKNIGKKVYSINSIQAQFLPVMFRPPLQTCEDINILKKDLS
jgi:inositol polyphosphate-4-phosphatase